jgi:hypothetical protein
MLLEWNHLAARMANIYFQQLLFTENRFIHSKLYNSAHVGGLPYFETEHSFAWPSLFRIGS